MGVLPVRVGHFFIELFSHRQNIFPRRQAGAIGQAKNMRINGKSRHAKCLIHHHICGFAPDTRQRHQRVHILRHVAIMLGQQGLRQRKNIFRLIAIKPDGFDKAANFSLAQRHHLGRIIGALK